MFMYGIIQLIEIVFMVCYRGICCRINSYGLKIISI